MANILVPLVLITRLEKIGITKHLYLAYGDEPQCLLKQAEQHGVCNGSKTRGQYGEMKLVGDLP